MYPLHKIQIVRDSDRIEKIDNFKLLLEMLAKTIVPLTDKEYKKFSIEIDKHNSYFRTDHRILCVV